MFYQKKWGLFLALAAFIVLLAGSPALGALVGPTNLSVTTATFDSITLTWQDNDTNEDGFIVWRYDTSLANWVQISPALALDTVTYTDAGLQQGTTYEYCVSSYITGEDAYSNTASGTTMGMVVLATIPDAPTNLNAVTLSDSSIALYWSDNADNESGYRMERQESGTGVWTAIATLAADIQTYTDTGLNASTQYFYRVVAFNIAGDSNLSNTADATTQDAAPPPVTIAPMVMTFLLGNTQYTIDGAVQTMDVAPIQQNSRMLLPIRYVVQPMGITPIWDGVSKVTIVSGTATIELWLNQNTAHVNGADVLIDPDNPNVVPITVPPGRVMLPLRFVAENLGCSALWDPTPPGSAVITYPAAP